MFVEQLPKALAIFSKAEGAWAPAARGEIQLDALLVEGLVKTFLMERFDRAVETPLMHRALWELACSSDPLVAIAAPRGHAKSTSLTHSYLLATLLFRQRDYALVVSDTEAQAVSFLYDLKTELLENDLLRAGFRIKGLTKETETEIVCALEGDYLFKITAKGAEQKVRGLKWRGKRPNLLIIDDLENDESVMNKERRSKMSHWFMNALLPCGSDDCIVRVVGTVLHQDALLTSCLDDRAWTTLRLDAHSDDFSEILWADKFPRARLEAIRTRFVNKGNPEGYAMEYRNQAIDAATAYFRKTDIMPLTPARGSGDRYSAVDFAISLKERADFTAILTVEVTPTGTLRVIDVRRGHWDSHQIIDEMFDVQVRHKPEIFVVEAGAIEKSLGPFLHAEMLARQVYLNLEMKVPTKDKIARAQSIKARMRAGAVEFDTEAEWFPALQSELLAFPRGKHDDQVDALSWIGLLLDEILPSETPEEEAAAAWYESQKADPEDGGRNPYTGY